MSARWVCVYEAPDVLGTNSVIALLEEAGIPARLVKAGKELPGFIVGEGPLTSAGTIMVPETEVEKALELIGGFLGSLGMLDELDHSGGGECMDGTQPESEI